ncbi:hypothetical protein SATMO3_09890 [Sporomusa aerivorans]
MILRDFGLRPKTLVDAAAEDGINLSHRRASEIINGQATIRPKEMAVIAKLLNKTVEELYVYLGSVHEVACPISSIGSGKLVTCCRQQCAWWDWEMRWCSIKNLTSKEELFEK